MLGDQLQGALLIGGIVLIGLGVIVGAIVAAVLIVRRRHAVAEEPRLGETFAGTTGTAAEESAFVLPSRGEGSASLGLAQHSSDIASTDSQSMSVRPFVASRPGPQPVAGLESIAPPPPPPPAAPSSLAVPPKAPSAWGDIVAPESAPVEEYGYTTGSFAPPGHLLSQTPTVAPHGDAVPQPIVEPAPATELTSPPLGNPWIGTGPQPPVASPAEPSDAASEGPADAPSGGSPDAPPLPTPSPETVPTAVIERIPLAAPAPPPFVAERDVAPEHDVAPEPSEPSEPEDDRTVLLGRPQRAPWLLILDTGERIDIPAESVVLGRRPAPIEQGVPGVTIADGTKTLSKVHARIDRVGEYWTLTDLASTNGSSVIEVGGRERLLPSGGSEVIRGRFLLGEVGMVLVRNPETPA